MKIGIFTETYKPTVNGVVSSIEAFRAQLEAKGHDYYIFAPANRMEADKQPQVYRFPSIHFPNDPFYPLAITWPSFIAESFFPPHIIKDLDIIHIQHFSAMGLYGLHFGQKYQIPVVYTYHTMAEFYTRYIPLIGSAFHPLVRAWTRLIAHRVDAIIVPTPSVKNYLRGLGIRRDMNIIPSGIDSKRYKPRNPEYAYERWHISRKQKLLLFVGRIAKEKNIDLLFEIFEKVRAEEPETHLILAGGGPDKERFVAYVHKAKLGHFVTFTGFLERDELEHLLGCVDLFVFPSQTDTQGIVILEAMAAGAVPVAADALGPHDIIEHNHSGLLSSLNSDDFSAKIVGLLNDPATRAQLAKAARVRAAEFDKAITGKAMEALYQRLVKKRQ